MAPVTEMLDADGFSEPLVDVYGTPWGQVLSGVDHDVFIVSGTTIVGIPVGIPDVE